MNSTEEPAEDGDMDEEEHMFNELVVIERPVYSQKSFDQGYNGGRRPSYHLKHWVTSKTRGCQCSWSCVGRFLSSNLPFLAIMREYSLRQDLLPDIIAGLTVGVMHIPQGMAYGQLSTLPTVYGLYVSFFPVIIYFFFGTSKHISIGTFAVITLMVGSTLEQGLKAHNLTPRTWNLTLDANHNETGQILDNSAEILDLKFKLAMSVTLVVGIVQLLLGVFHLGFLTVYLSDPLISGFTTGAACHVLTSQIKHIFGISMGQYSGAFRLIYSYRDIFMNLPKTNVATLIASIICLLILILIKEFISTHPKIKPKLKMPIPAELIVVVLGTVISYFVNLEEKYQVKIVGDIPVGLPAPNLAAFSYFPEVITDGIAIAIVAFAISVSLAKIFAKRHDYEVDANQELKAYGICNIFSSFFSSFVSTASLSRSLVQEGAGCRTQVTGLISSALLLVVLLVVGPYFQTLPNCVLASIILVALKGMFLQFLELRALWSISLVDFAVWLVSFVATFLLDVQYGLLVGVCFALLTVIVRSQRPYTCLLGRVPGTDIYRDINVYNSVVESPYIKIFRFDSALFFANAELFKTSLYKLTVDPSELKKKRKKMDKKRHKEEADLLRTPNTADVEMTTAKSNVGDGSATDGTRATTGGPNRSSSQTPAATQTGSCDEPSLTDIRFIIVDCSGMSYVDSMGVKTLQQVIVEMRAFNITVFLAQCKSSVREIFQRTDFPKTGDKRLLFITIHDAVVTAELQHAHITKENVHLKSGLVLKGKIEQS